MRRSDGNLEKSVLWFHHVDPGDDLEQLPAKQSHRPVFGNLCIDFILEHH